MSTGQGVMQMRDILKDDLQLATAIDIIVHDGSNITLLSTDEGNGTQVFLDGCATINYTAQPETYEPAWAAVIYQPISSLQDKKVFSERVHAIQHAIASGYRYIH